MKVLVIGTGGRDHAIAWKFSNSPRVRRVYVAHGNAGIARTAECVNLRTIEEMADFAQKERIDLTFCWARKASFRRHCRSFRVSRAKYHRAGQ